VGGKEDTNENKGLSDGVWGLVVAFEKLPTKISGQGRRKVEECQ
jgi:hypothetical protein